VVFGLGLASVVLTWPREMCYPKQNEKNAQRDANTAVGVVRRSQIPPPATDPLPGGAGRPTFNQLESVNTFTYKHSLVRIDARNFELSW